MNRFNRILLSIGALLLVFNLGQEFEKASRDRVFGEVMKCMTASYKDPVVAVEVSPVPTKHNGSATTPLEAEPKRQEPKNRADHLRGNSTAHSDHDGIPQLQYKENPSVEPETQPPLPPPTAPPQTMVEVVQAPPTNAGFIHDVKFLCEELLNRTSDDTPEGQEPWRTPGGGGLLWKSNDCKHQGESVLGNHLTRWYMMRVVGAAAGVTVEASCHSAVTDQILNPVPPHATQICKPDDFSWKKYCHSCMNNGGRCLYPHEIQELSHSASTVRADLRNLANKVLEDKSDLAADLDDVAIHIRIGDITRQDNAQYGLVPYRTLVKLIPPSAKRIGLVTAPFKQNRAGWGAGDPELNQAIVVSAMEYIQSHFPNAVVSIRNNNTETHDMVFTRLIKTDHLICGPSTYCVLPALATRGSAHIVSSPLFGRSSPTWIDKVSEYESFENVHYVHDEWVPANQVFDKSVSEIIQILSAPSTSTDALTGKTEKRNETQNILVPSDVSRASNGKVDIKKERTQEWKLAPTQSLFRPRWDSRKSAWEHPLPKTRFTEHIVTQLVDEYDVDDCRDKGLLTVEVDQNAMIPRLHLNTSLIPGNHRIISSMASALENHVFTDSGARVLPQGKLKIDVSVQDNRPYTTQNCPWESSAPGGYFSVFNFQEISRWSKNESMPPPLPWDERERIPVWRGTPWVLPAKTMPGHVEQLEKELDLNVRRNIPNATDIFLEELIDLMPHHRRLQLCLFSFYHPELVNAKMPSSGIIAFLFKNNATNGMDRFLPFDKIPSYQYVTRYQTHVVMGGVGAAFRTAGLLGQGIAVILQDYPFEEWFTRLMKPFVHYIPLDQKLTNLEKILQWTKDHPDKVYEIAQNGRAFYEEYLSFPAMAEFYYELIFRLMMKTNEIDSGSTGESTS